MRQHYPLNSLGAEDPGKLPWIDGVPSTGVEGSYPGHAIVTDAEAEILAAIDAAGLTRAGEDLTQLVQAISRGVYLGAFTGSANALSAPLPNSAAIPALLIGMRFVGRTAVANTGAVTVTLTGFGQAPGTLPLLGRGGGALKAGDLPVGADFDFRYDGSALRLVGPAPSEIAALAVSSGQVVQVVQGPILYVRPDGSDTASTNDGSADDSTHAFATDAAAIKYGLARYNLAGQTLTIQHNVPNVNYAFPGTIPAGAGKILLRGNPASPGACAFSGAGPGGGGQACLVLDGSRVEVNGIGLSNSGQINHTISAVNGGSGTLRNCLLAMTAGSNVYSQIFAGAAGSFSLAEGVSTSGNAAAFLNATTGQITQSASPVTVLGNPFYAFAFAVAQLVGEIGLLPGASYSGSATGARWSVSKLAAIQTSGQGGGIFPGSSAGTTDSATFGLII